MFIIITAFGCASIFDIHKPEKNVKEEISDKLYYLTSELQQDELSKLTSDEEIYAFENNVWLIYDPTPQTSKNEFKEIYEERFGHANRYFKECGKEGWKTDRGRIYILNGSPYDVIREPFHQNTIGDYNSDLNSINVKFSHIMIKEVEIWTYNKSAQSSKFQNVFSHNNLGMTQYVFIDMIGSGSYRLMQSTEDMELDDPRVHFNYFNLR
ncbi:MAG: GWxTD domain-containing protein [Ignavibacteriales bacterium]|nr:GWxTD domain-containing protein [Ignavibacteriales bacterium]